MVTTDELPCKKWCNKDKTVTEILEDTVHCNFCDVPYAIIGELYDNKRMG